MKFFVYYFYVAILLHSAYASALSSATLDQLVHELPEFTLFHEYQIEKIDGGLTNHNFKVIFPTHTYFVRLGGSNKALLGLDSSREFFCTQTAAALKIAPEILFFLPDQQAMALPFIASKPPEKNRTDYARVLAAVRQLHQSEALLPTTFCPYQTIENYHQQATALRPDHHIPLASYVLPVVEEIRAAIPHFREIVPCHLDLYNLNFLDDGEKIWIVDWEYSAMADPFYDIATLVSSDRLSLDEMEELLEIYLEHPTKEDRAYLYLMTILADVRWWLWNYIQAEASPIQSQYLEFADYSLYHILQKIAHPQYQQSLRLLIKEPH